MHIQVLEVERSTGYGCSYLLLFRNCLSKELPSQGAPICSYLLLKYCSCFNPYSLPIPILMGAPICSYLEIVYQRSHRAKELQFAPICFLYLFSLCEQPGAHGTIWNEIWLILDRCWMNMGWFWDGNGISFGVFWDDYWMNLGCFWESFGIELWWT